MNLFGADQISAPKNSIEATPGNTRAAQKSLDQDSPVWLLIANPPGPRYCIQSAATVGLAKSKHNTMEHARMDFIATPFFGALGW